MEEEIIGCAGVSKWFAEVSKHCAEVSKRYAGVSKHCAEVSKRYAGVSKHYAGVSSEWGPADKRSAAVLKSIPEVKNSVFLTRNAFFCVELKWGNGRRLISDVLRDSSVLVLAIAVSGKVRLVSSGLF